MCSLDVSLVIETVLNAVIAISAAAAALYGIKGINTWRRELKGKSEYEIAKSALKAAYRIRDGFDHVRGDAILLHEYPAEMRTHRGDIAPENRHEALVSVYAKRFEYLQEYFLKLEEAISDAEVEWGGAYSEKIEPLRECRNDLMQAIRYETGIYKGRNPKNKYETDT